MWKALAVAAVVASPAAANTEACDLADDILRSFYEYFEATSENQSTLTSDDAVAATDSVQKFLTDLQEDQRAGLDDALRHLATLRDICP